MLAEPFFRQLPPKSTGRDLFNPAWLRDKLFQSSMANKLSPEDVQATLVMLTATSIARAIHNYAPQTRQVYVCGGGAKNRFLMEVLENRLLDGGHSISLATSETLGVDPMHVESLAFAWLAYRFTHRRTGNLPSVTGAASGRILGALYPA